VSLAMLAEAAKNTASLQNVSLIHAVQLDSLAPRSFDFIHSLIVFQHIPVKRGEEIYGKLLTLLKPGGIDAIHFTFVRDLSFARSVLAELRRLPLIHTVTNILRGRPLSDPPQLGFPRTGKISLSRYNAARVQDLSGLSRCTPGSSVLRSRAWWSDSRVRRGRSVFASQEISQADSADSRREAADRRSNAGAGSVDCTRGA
jgi:hypothetical protein